MRSRVIIALGFLLLLGMAAKVFWFDHSLSYIRKAPENQVGLWIAALKHFDGPVYYVGSDAQYSYFRAGDIVWSRYKAQTSKLRLPRVFQLGAARPYLVAQDMVQLHQ